MTIKERRDIESIAMRYQERVQTECVKKHLDFFRSCDEPACALLREIGRFLNWKLEDHALISPPQEWARDWMKQVPL